MLRVSLLLDGAERGSWNMALDEALLEQADDAGAATLRFYRWSEPTLSLGYFQSHRERQSHPPSSDCPLVRRASGGGALVHDRELTYSFTAPVSDRLTADVKRLFDAFHKTLIDVLAETNVAARLCPGNTQQAKPAQPFLCFQRRAAGDVLLGDAKILGSAQRRRRRAVLQHGGLLLGASPFAPELPGVAELAGVDLPTPQLIDRWTDRLRQRLNADIAPARLAPATTERALAIEREKFASDHWTLRR